MKYSIHSLSEKHKRIIGAVITVIAAVSLFYIVYSDRTLFGNKLRELETATSEFLLKTLPVEDAVLTPPPLRAGSDVEGSLSSEGIFLWTNSARLKEGGVSLKVNSTLTAVAERKLQDMFFYQYFDHVSPTGLGAGDLAKRTGYDYIIIGENLALGNFADDEALVDAWMESPGHRANILDKRYTEIGVAVRQGLYEGKLTWIAVQEFGRPTSECTQPAQTIQQAIDAERRIIDQKEKLLTEEKNTIDTWEGGYTLEYAGAVEAYNEHVREYNALVTSLKEKITEYNNGVIAFNACAQGR